MINKTINNQIIKICNENKLGNNTSDKITNLLNYLSQGNDSQEEIRRHIEVILNSFDMEK